MNRDHQKIGESLGLSENLKVGDSTPPPTPVVEHDVPARSLSRSAVDVLTNPPAFPKLDPPAVIEQIATLTQERDEARKEAEFVKFDATMYCPNCGACGIEGCCPAPKCAYFKTYTGELGQKVIEAQEEAQDYRAQRDNAEARIATLTAALEGLRVKHRECEDCWYSCPKSAEGCCNEAQGDACNCGADEQNAKIDAALTAAAPQGGEQ